MNARWVFVFCTILMAMVLLAGCSQPTASGAAPVTSQAPVDSVEVAQVLGSSSELRVLVQGRLADGCTRLADPVVNHSGGLVVVILPAVREGAVRNCGGAVPYERTISLGRDFTPGEYSVSVNGKQTLFSLAAAGSQPEPAQTATPLPTAVAAAQATPTQEPTTAPTASAPTATETTTSTPVAETPASTATATATSAPTQPSTASEGACINKAAFFADITVPDGTVFDPQAGFTKTWRIRNAGTCTWKGYSLVYQDGDLLGSKSPAAIPGSVAPGATVDISVAMTAPQAAGTYYSDWKITAADGSVFGLGSAGEGLIYAKIAVRIQGQPAAEPVCAFTTDPAVEAELLQLINDARKANGLAPFKLVDKISTAARLHSEDMACNDFIEHYGSDGSTWLTRIQAQGVKFKSASENIYAGIPANGGDAQGAFTWWMNSKVHHDNILNPKSTQIGIGYVFYDGNFLKGYYTLNFVQP